MTLFRVAVMWRIPAAALLGAIFLGLAVVVGDLNLNLPMSDGPRKARQALLLTLPLVLSTLLLPPLSDVHGSLPRQRLHHWATLIVFWSVTIAVCTGAWMGSGIARNVMAFQPPLVISSRSRPDASCEAPGLGAGGRSAAHLLLEAREGLGELGVGRPLC